MIFDPKTGVSIQPAFPEEGASEKLRLSSEIFDEGGFLLSPFASREEPSDDLYSSDALQFLTGKKSQGAQTLTFSRENLERTFDLGNIVFRAPKEDVKSVEKTSEGVKVTLKRG